MIINRVSAKAKRWLAIMAIGAGFVTLSVSEPARMVVAAAIRDPLALLSQRSPGARAPGALTQTKHALRDASPIRQRPASFSPEERVLPSVLMRPISPGEEPLAPAGEPYAGDMAPTSFTKEPDASFAGVPSSFGAPGVVAGLLDGPGGGDSTGGGGGGGGGGSTGGGGDTTTTPPPAVPEPASWLMMILGFGAIGAALRRRHVAIAARATARG